MKKASTLVEILYYTEDYDLVIYCPQLDFCGVCEGILITNNMSENLVRDYFKRKLDKRAARFDTRNGFMEFLFLHGCWNIGSDNPGPKPLKYFVENYWYLQDVLKLPNIKRISYEFEYSLEITERIFEISNTIDTILDRG